MSLSNIRIFSTRFSTIRPMSKRSKLEKFAENLILPNVFENFSFSDPSLYSGPQQKVDFKGKWAADYFKNSNAICLELACGRGEYCLGLATMHADCNYIGVDVKGARIWKGAKTAWAKGLHNVAFVRSKIELLPGFFSSGEINEVWITFPDPFLQKSKSGRRLSSLGYLNVYAQFLKPGAILHLKTDEQRLYEFSLEQIQEHPDYHILCNTPSVYETGPDFPEIHIQTYYEQMHRNLGKQISYIRFQFK